MTPGVSILEMPSSHLIHNLSELSNVGLFTGNVKYKKLVSMREESEKYFKQVIHKHLSPDTLQGGIFTIKFYSHSHAG